MCWVWEYLWKIVLMAAILGRSTMMLVPRQGAVLAALEREGRRRKLGEQAAG